MGAKWSTVSTTTYNDGGPADDGSATEANRVKYATIKSDLTDPLDTAIDSIVANLDQAFNHTTTAVSTNYTTVASDHTKILETTDGIITLLAAATAGAGYRVGVYASGADITVSRGSTDTIDGATSLIVRKGRTAWFTVNAAGDGYLSLYDRTGAPASVATTSGRTAQFTGIPSGIGRIDIGISGVSIDGATDYLALRVGTGGVETTSGYLGGATNTGGTQKQAASSLWPLNGGVATAAAGWNGGISLTLVDAATNTWSMHGSIGLSTSGDVANFAGSVALAGALDMVSFRISGSADSFDAGKVSIVYS